MRRLTRVGVLLLCGVIAGLALGGAARAQLLDRKAMSLAEAKKMAAAAHAEAVKNNWRMVIAVVDPDGTLIYLERMDDVQTGSVQVAIDKARTAAAFNRSTTVLAGLVKGDEKANPPVPPRPELLKLFLLPSQGGLPIKAGEYFIGGIGCSGGSSPQDEQTCAAGLAAMGK